MRKFALFFLRYICKYARMEFNNFAKHTACNLNNVVLYKKGVDFKIILSKHCHIFIKISWIFTGLPTKYRVTHKIQGYPQNTGLPTKYETLITDKINSHTLWVTLYFHWDNLYNFEYFLIQIGFTRFAFTLKSGYFQFKKN